MKIHFVGAEFLYVGGGTVRQTDRHDEANSRFSQFCERYSQTENYTLAQIQDTYLYLSQLNT